MARSRPWNPSSLRPPIARLSFIETHLLPAANVAESLVPLLSLAAYVPQWRHLWRTRDSRSISLVSWSNRALAYAISIFYAAVLLAVTGRGVPLLLTTCCGLAFVLITLSLAWRFLKGSG